MGENEREVPFVGGRVVYESPNRLEHILHAFQMSPHPSLSDVIS
jgi:ATP-dependent exoDNAse (exonuclease V) alpha subunit